MNQALLVIDMINDIVDAHGAVASCADYCNNHPVVANINKIIAYCRQKEMAIFFIRVGFNKDYSDCPSMWKSRLQEKNGLQIDTWGTSVMDSIDFDVDQDKLITKTRVSPFYQTLLAADLRNMGINKLLITGVATNNAIDLCAREAWDRDLNPTIITDACGAATTELHEAILVALPPVINTNTTLEYCMGS